ncbi:MAG: hypothetical protein KJ737_07675 [Proteobacteria bacterium]|nr:hypothetical protein [Pseudomonadota bacterium]
MALVVKRLHHSGLYGGEGTDDEHDKDSFYMAREWVKHWGDTQCSELYLHPLTGVERLATDVFERIRKNSYTNNKRV